MTSSLPMTRSIKTELLRHNRTHPQNLINLTLASNLMESQEQERFDFEKDYEKLKEHYGLPELEALAEDFDIEKIMDKETAFLVREIRRTINEKVTAYIHLFETLINPASPPLFVFKILKSMGTKEKEKIQEFYKILSKTQIEVMKLDTVYSEEKEAKFIAEVFNAWQEIKVEVYKLLEFFEANFENGELSKGRSYFD